MTVAEKIVIVGAGPVGLAAGIELARRGILARIVDKKAGPVAESRALGVNARTLSLLEPCGATEHILSRGKRLHHFSYHVDGRTIATLSLDDFGGAFPPITVLPQSEVEAVLLEVLSSYGVSVEWQTNMLSLHQNDDGTSRLVLHTPRAEETVIRDIVIGADGARSAVRESAGLSFDGVAYDTEWGLADVHVRTDLSLEGVNAFDLAPVTFVVIPIRDNLVRLVCSEPDIFAHVPREIEVLDTIWQSKFRIAHRQVKSYQSGGIFLAGDAAHVHSPLGARGMNLGIEDAAWLAWHIAQGTTERYTRDRLSVGRQVVGAADPATRLISSQTGLARFVRHTLLPSVIEIPPVRRRILHQMSGQAAPKAPWLLP